MFTTNNCPDLISPNCKQTQKRREQKHKTPIGLATPIKLKTRTRVWPKEPQWPTPPTQSSHMTKTIGTKWSTTCKTTQNRRIAITTTTNCTAKCKCRMEFNDNGIEANDKTNNAKYVENGDHDDDKHVRRTTMVMTMLMMTMMKIIVRTTAWPIMTWQLPPRRQWLRWGSLHVVDCAK